MKTFHMHFYENRKIFFTISLGIMAIGLIFNIIFGVKLDIQFTGGAMINYSYTGDIDASKVQSAVESLTKRDASVSINKNIQSAAGGQTQNNVTISFTGTQSLTLDNQKAIQTELTKEYPNANFQIVESNSVNPSMGQSFFVKCIVAVLIAFLLLDIYIAIRFRKIGGTAASVFAIIALLHDVAMVYFTFVLVRIPLNDSFIAVVLTILGYSLNDTIVVYDRIRENRKLLGIKSGYGELVNLSINQTFTRSVYTAGCTFLSIAIVFIVGSFYHLSTVTTFALPMMMGILTGGYSSICIAGPLYVMWESYKTKQKVAAAVHAEAEKPQKAAKPLSAAAQAPADETAPAAPKAPSAAPAKKAQAPGKPKPKKRKR
jgi:preprotein translocase subunit SecF